MSRLPAVFAILLLTAVPAVAEDISIEADHVLWCASAFALLANDASEQSDVIETELYDNLAATLTKKGIDLLRQRKIADDRIGAIIQGYDDAVYVQLDTPGARYPIDTCETLIAG